MINQLINQNDLLFQDCDQDHHEHHYIDQDPHNRNEMIMIIF